MQQPDDVGRRIVVETAGDWQESGDELRSRLPAEERSLLDPRPAKATGERFSDALIAGMAFVAVIAFVVSQPWVPAVGLGLLFVVVVIGGLVAAFYGLLRGAARAASRGIEEGKQSARRRDGFD